MSYDMGRCLRHGYVTERCCRGWEALPDVRFLRDAVKTVRVRSVVTRSAVNAIGGPQTIPPRGVR